MSVNGQQKNDPFFEPIRVAPDVDGGRLMKDPVQDRRLDHRIVGSFRDECLNVNWTSFGVRLRIVKQFYRFRWDKSNIKGGHTGGSVGTLIAVKPAVRCCLKA